MFTHLYRHIVKDEWTEWKKCNSHAIQLMLSFDKKKFTFEYKTIEGE